MNLFKKWFDRKAAALERQEIDNAKDWIAKKYGVWPSWLTEDNARQLNMAHAFVAVEFGSAKGLPVAGNATDTFLCCSPVGLMPGVPFRVAQFLTSIEPDRKGRAVQILSINECSNSAPGTNWRPGDLWIRWCFVPIRPAGAHKCLDCHSVLRAKQLIHHSVVGTWCCPVCATATTGSVAVPVSADSGKRPLGEYGT